MKERGVLGGIESSVDQELQGGKERFPKALSTLRDATKLIRENGGTYVVCEEQCGKKEDQEGVVIDEETLRIMKWVVWAMYRELVSSGQKGFADKALEEQ